MAGRVSCVYAYLSTSTLSPDFNSTVQWVGQIVICLSQRFTMSIPGVPPEQGYIFIVIYRGDACTCKQYAEENGAAHGSGVFPAGFGNL